MDDLDDFDDVDDYHGWLSTPAKNKDGSPVPNAAGWQRGNTGSGYGGHKWSWWLGNQAGYTYNSYYNKMVHCNFGEEMGTYNPIQPAAGGWYNFYNYCYLQSPGFNVPAPANPYMMWRWWIYLQYSYYDYAKVGWSSSGSVTQHWASWNQRWYFSGQYYYQSALYRYYAPAMTAPTYCKFYYGIANTYYTITHGVHVGSVAVMPNFTPPAGF